MPLPLAAHTHHALRTVVHGSAAGVLLWPRFGRRTILCAAAATAQDASQGVTK